MSTVPSHNLVNRDFTAFILNIFLLICIYLRARKNVLYQYNVISACLFALNIIVVSAKKVMSEPARYAKYKEHICRKCVVYEIHVSSLVNLLFNVVVACFETDVYMYCSYLLYIN
jgi:hypothetical protein